MDKCYIILFEDRTYQVYNHKMDMRDFQKGARQFEIGDQTPVIEIPEWINRFPWKPETKYIKEV